MYWPIDDRALRRETARQILVKQLPSIMYRLQCANADVSKEVERLRQLAGLAKAELEEEEATR